MDEPDDVLPPETAGTGEPPMQKLPPAFVANMCRPGEAPSAPSGFHDDCVIALALANSLRREHAPAAPMPRPMAPAVAGRFRGQARALA